MDSRVNLNLGTLTTAFASAGAIFTRVNTVRALSGIAGFFSGARAEFNQNYFANQTIHVLTEAFYKRRRAIQKSMIRKGKQNLLDYSVERAIADAVQYHENCSLIAGFEVAALAVTRVNNPGANQLKEFQKITRGLALEADTIAAVRAEAEADGEVLFMKTSVAEAQKDASKTAAHVAK